MGEIPLAEGEKRKYKKKQVFLTQILAVRNAGLMGANELFASNL